MWKGIKGTWAWESMFLGKPSKTSQIRSCILKQRLVKAMWVILSRDKGRSPDPWLPAHRIHYSTPEVNRASTCRTIILKCRLWFWFWSYRSGFLNETLSLHSYVLALDASLPTGTWSRTAAKGHLKIWCLLYWVVYSGVININQPKQNLPLQMPCALPPKHLVSSHPIWSPMPIHKRAPSTQVHYALQSQPAPSREQAFRKSIMHWDDIKEFQQIKGNFSGVQFKTFKQLKARVQSSAESKLHCVRFQLIFLVCAERPPRVEAGLQTWEITEATDT